MGKATSNAIIGFLAGAAAGTVIGVLYAPDKGSKTRKKIKKESQRLSSEVTENLNDQVDNLKEYITDFVDDAKVKFSKLEKDLKEKVSETQKKATEMVDNKAKQAKKTA